MGTPTSGSLTDSHLLEILRSPGAAFDRAGVPGLTEVYEPDLSAGLVHWLQARVAVGAARGRLPRPTVVVQAATFDTWLWLLEWPVTIEAAAAAHQAIAASLDVPVDPLGAARPILIPGTTWRSQRVTAEALGDLVAIDDLLTLENSNA